MDLNLESICRLCLQCGILKSIFKTTRLRDSTKVSCTDMISSLMSFPVDTNDGLPLHICKKCSTKLKSAYVFKIKCENSYEVLTKHHNKLNIECIKQEVVDDSYVDRNEEDRLGDDVDLKNVKLEFVEPIESEMKYGIDVESSNFNNNTVVNDESANYESDFDIPIMYLKQKSASKKLVKKKIKKSAEVTSKIIEDKIRTKEILGLDVKSLKNESGLFVCNQCPKTVACRRAFIRHLERHLGIKSFFCDICQKYYARKWTHMKKHSHPPVKNFKCEKCGKMFDNKGSLNVHLISHSTEMPHVCDDCGKAFKTMARLLIHKKVHSDVKEFMCQYCSKEFRMQKNMETHIMYKHTQVRNYQCSTCDKKFVTGHCLSIHERRHLGIKKFSCKTCDKAFVSSSALSTHLRMHTKEKPYACRVCSVAFRRSDHRNRHERTAHGMDFKISNSPMLNNL